MQYCSFQHRTLLPSPVTSTTGCCFYFDSASSFLPALLPHSFPVAYWAPTYQRGEFIFQCHIFLPFHTVYGVLKARILKWFAVSFSSGPHSVSLSTMTRPSWVAPRAWLSFIELDKANSMKQKSAVLYPWRCLQQSFPNVCGIQRNVQCKQEYHLLSICLGSPSYKGLLNW